MNEYEDCAMLWPTTTSTSTTSSPAGCCHGDLTSYKANDKCVGIDNQKSCERKSCTWLLTDAPEDCVITTTTSTPRTTELGCCAGTTAKNTEMCNAKVGRESCERSGKCEFRVDEDDCSWPTTSTSTPSTTSEEVGCCKGEDFKTNQMCNTKLDRQSCERGGKCVFIVDGSIEEECRVEEEKEPGCCYGDTAKTNEMCAAKEDKEMCERQATKFVWRPDESDDEPADCSLPTTTSAPAGCCRGDSYKANGKCNKAMSQGMCEDNGCSWLETEDPSDCVITTTETVEEVGCCKGDSAKTNAKCNAKVDRSKCDRSSSCHWIGNGVVDVDCVIDEPSTTISPGCCYGNPDAAYSKRWMDTCTGYFTERECLFNVDEDGNARCVYQPMSEEYDCSQLWPTTTSTPTEPAGCCHGDLTSYKANDKCVGIDNQKSCERKSCSWLLTDDPEDCVITTTTSTPRTTELGCCAGTTAKNTEMCNAKVGRESCERSGKCEFRADEDDCSWPTTTSEPWLCAKMGAKQRRGKSAASHKQESVLFGGEGVISETMQTTISLSTLMMFVIATFTAFQLFKWWSARKVGEYTKLADAAPIATQNGFQSV